MSLVHIGVIASSFNAGGSLTPWAISTALRTGDTYSTSEGFVTSVRVKPDGTELYYHAGGTTDQIIQRNISTPWDLTTVSGTATTLSVGTQDSFGTSFWFRPDGTQLFYIGEGTDSLYSYTMSTPWDINTATFDSASGSLTGVGTPASLYIDPTGAYVFVNDGTTVYSFEMTTPWDVTTLTTRSLTFNTSEAAGDTYKSVFFKTDGTKLYVQVTRDESTTHIYQYGLSVAWDVSTASTLEEQYDRPSSPFFLGEEMFINPDTGTEMVILGGGGTIEYYDIG